MVRTESLAREGEGGVVRFDGSGKEEVVGVDQQKHCNMFADVRAGEVEAEAVEVQVSTSLRKGHFLG